MRIPTRKSEEDRRALAGEPDHYLTPETIERLKRQLETLEKTDRPSAKLELQRAQEMGDLSENFGYQEAKRRLRSINDRIVSIGERIASAIPIRANAGGTIQIGSKVTLDLQGRSFVFDILGSQETDPTRGRISYVSPLGNVLIGKKVGDEATVEANGRSMVYRVVDVR